MHANQQEPGMRAGPARGTHASRGGERHARRIRPTLMRRAGWGAATLAVLIVAGVCAGGCGNRATERSAATQAPEPAVASGPRGSDAGAWPGRGECREHDVLGAGARGEQRGARRGLGGFAAARCRGDGDRDPGVHGRQRRDHRPGLPPDVVGVTLGDRSGGHSPFAYDSGADLWRVAYRVPVKPGTDRLPLRSPRATRRDAGDARVVFLNIEREAAACDTLPMVKP